MREPERHHLYLVPDTAETARQADALRAALVLARRLRLRRDRAIRSRLLLARTLTMRW